MRGMQEPQLETAPRWRSILAGLVDTAVAGAAVWGLKVRGGVARTATIPVVPASQLLRQQLGSPGQRLFGVRTVDQRTGTRVALWRSLVALGAGVGTHLLTARMSSPEATPQQAHGHERHLQAVGETYQRHSADSAARDEERAGLMEQGPRRLDPWRQIGLPLAVRLVEGRLHRRLIVTKEIRRGG
jgi:hypothetical protein